MNHRPLKVPPGTQIQIDKKYAQSLTCSCGCNSFQKVVLFFYVSGLANPTGEDIVFHEDRLACSFCKAVYNMDELKTNEEWRRLNKDKEVKKQ
jgi:redox-regulated HSP33 family molecular chaperone